MELWLAVREESGNEREFAARIEPTTSIGELAKEIARQTGGSGSTLFLYRTGKVLDAISSLADSGIRVGDLVRLAPPTGSGPLEGAISPLSPVVEFAVIGGPLSGVRRELSTGSYKIGRSSDCELRLEDPLISRTHVVATVGTGGTVTVADAGSSNGTFIEGGRVTGERQLAGDEVIEAGGSLFTFRSIRATPSPERRPIEDGSIPFNRPPRVTRPAPQSTFELPSPPELPHKQRLPLAACLAPLILGAVLFVVLKSTAKPGAEDHSSLMLIMMALSPVMAVGSFIEQRGTGRSDYKRKENQFREGLESAASALREALERSSQLRRQTSPDATELLSRAKEVRPDLWERRTKDADFLHLRIGWGDQPSGLELRIPASSNEELVGRAKEVAARYSLAASVPMVVDLRDAGVLGISGSSETVQAQARWLVAQIATLHSPRDVAIVAVVPRSNTSGWNWLKWLPHARPEALLLDTPLLADDVHGAQSLMEALAGLIESRKEADRRFVGTDQASLPAVVLVLQEGLPLARSLVARVLQEGPACGIFTIWAGGESSDLPGECGAIIEGDEQAEQVSVSYPGRGELYQGGGLEGVSPGLATEIARAIAPLRDISAGAHSTIPQEVSLLKLLGSETVDSEMVLARWDEGRTGLSAPLGIGSAGPFDMNLTSDGPHALVGGTTGAGKSELLQSLVASLAVTIPAERLNLILVDYKGGAAFKDCVALPHTVGFVTDLDGHLVHRALVSLNAELKRREEVLRNAGASDLASLTSSDPGSAPPSLLIIVDEFATLAKELPEFVEGVVDIAQRGRSLGVHLILATQRPAGVINDNIRANTNLRIALRVNDEADSQDVLGTRDAAHIPRSRPGRAFVRTGQAELREFQTAYVGGRTGGETDTGVRLRELSFGGPKALGAERTDRDEDRPSDLQQLVTATISAHEASGRRESKRPWLPPLETVIPLEALPAGDSSRLPLGIADLPARQRQEAFSFDFEKHGHLLVYGTGGSGKTSLLRTIAAAGASAVPANMLHIYAMDFAGRGLDSLKALPHCGGVVLGNEMARVERLMSMLQDESARRKLAIGQLGVTSFEEHNVRADQPLPRILVMLDSYQNFAATFEMVNFGELIEALPRLVGEGRALGIHYIITSDRATGVPSALTGQFSTKLTLRMASDDEYANLGFNPRSLSGSVVPPGRGYLDSKLEIQFAVVDKDPTGQGQARGLTELGDRLGEAGLGDVSPVRLLPEEVEKDSLPAPSGPMRALLGIRDKDLGPHEVDLSEGHYLVSGPYRSGRSNALGQIVASLHQATPEAEIHLLAPRKTLLSTLDLWTSSARGAEECAAAAARLNTSLDTGERVIIVIDDALELVDSPAAGALESIARRGRDAGLTMIVGAETQGLQRSFGGFLAEVRKDRHGLLLSPDIDLDGDLLGVRLPRRTKQRFPTGRGYAVERNVVDLVQVSRL